MIEHGPFLDGPFRGSLAIKLDAEGIALLQGALVSDTMALIIIGLLVGLLVAQLVAWMVIASTYRKMWLEAKAAVPKRNRFGWGLAGSASEQHWIHEGQRQNVARVLVAHDGTETTFCGSCGRMVHHPDCPVVTAGAA